MAGPALKTVLPNACLRRGFRLHGGSGGQVGRQADFVIEGCVDPSPLPPASDFGEASRYDATSPLGEPKHREGFFGDHTGYYTLPDPYPVFHATAITHRKTFKLGTHSESPQETQPLSRFVQEVVHKVSQSNPSEPLSITSYGYFTRV